MRDQDVVDMSTLNGIISIAHLVLAVYLSLQSCPAPEFAPLGLARKYEREVWAKMRHMLAHRSACRCAVLNRYAKIPVWVRRSVVTNFGEICLIGPLGWS